MSNENTNIFEQASRLGDRLTFSSSVGEIPTNDLWKLPLQHATRPSLDAIGMALQAAINKTGEVTSLVNPASKGDPILQLKYDIVKHIIDVKIAERDQATAEREKAEKKQKLMELIEKKKNDQLEGTSLEDLEKQLQLLQG